MANVIKIKVTDVFVKPMIASVVWLVAVGIERILDLQAAKQNDVAEEDT